MKINCLKIFLFGLLFVFFTACSEDDLDYANSVFQDEPPLDPTSFTYAFDKWLEDSLRIPYNIQYEYKLQDVATDINYNMIPVKIEYSKQMALLLKTLWIDVYKDVATATFLQEHGIRSFSVVGNMPITPGGWQEDGGSAEGGVRITLLNVNSLNYKSAKNLDDYLMTIHREFTNILLQKKTMPKEYEKLSLNNYAMSDWRQITESDARPHGFINKFAARNPQYDFAEVVAATIVYNATTWAEIEYMGKLPAPEDKPNPNGLTGDEIIKRKQELCRKYLRDSWGIHLDSLAKSCQDRRGDLEEYMKELENMNNK